MTSSWRLALIVLALAAPCGAASAAEANCFEPLTDHLKRDPADFKDLKDLELPAKLPSPGPGVVTIQTPSTGKGPINIDFYWITFTKPKDVTGKVFFQALRQKYADFASGEKKKFAFGPYAASNRVDDPDRLINSRRWESDDPTGAVMSFKLGSIIPNTKVQAGRTKLFEKNGDVQAICASDLDFVFATVESKDGGMHPVAGFRGFGLTADPKADTWTFYTKAIDRNSGDWTNRLVTMKGENELFCRGHEFWKEFFGQIRSHLERSGLKVSELNVTNHGPVDYPLGTGTGPWKTLECPLAAKPKKDS